MRKRRSRNKTRERLHKRPKLSLYDAVAGRANYEGFLSRPRPSKYRDWTSNTIAPIPPEEVLFRFDGAPARYEEDDIYFADRHLNQRNALLRLPDSDLLKALHAYVSDFYGALPPRRRDTSFRSLDETALLALGILVEEAARHICSEAEPPADLEDETASDTESVTESETSESSIESETSDVTVKSEIESETSDVKSEIKSETDEIPPKAEPSSDGIKSDPDTNAGTSQPALDSDLKIESDASQSTLDGDVKIETDANFDAELPMLSGNIKTESSEISQASTFTLQHETKVEPDMSTQTIDELSSPKIKTEEED